MLLNTDRFQNVKVSKTGKQLNITVKEYPLLNKVLLSVTGGPKLDTNKFVKFAGLDKRTVLSPSKIKSGAEKLRHYYAAQHSTSNVSVRALLQPKGSMADLKFVVDITKSKQIQDIRFIGNQGLSTKELRNKLEYKKLGLHPLPPVIQLDIISKIDFANNTQSLIDYAQSRGYLDFKITSMTIETENNTPYLVICIDEGKQYKVANVKILNQCNILSKELLQECILLKEGEVYNQDLANVSQYKLHTELHKRRIYGYVVDCNLEQDKDTGLVNAEFSVRKTDIYKIGEIRIRNNNKTNAQVIYKYLKFREGDIFSSIAISDSKDRLMRSGLFDEVEITQVPSKTPNSIDIVIDLVERSSFSIGILGNLSGNGASLDLTEANLFGTGMTASLNCEISSDPSVMARILEPNLLGSDVQLFVEVTSSSRSLNSGSFFQSSGAIERVKDYMFGFDYPKFSDFVQSISTSDLTQDSSAARHSLPYGLAPNWSESPTIQGLSENRAAIKLGAIVPTEYGKFTLSIAGAKRDIMYSYRLDETAVEERNDMIYDSRRNVYLSGTRYVRDNALLGDYEYDADGSRFSAAPSENGVKFNPRTGNYVLTDQNLSEYNKNSFRQSDKVTNLIRGTGRNRIYEPYLTEKIEAILTGEYSNSHFVTDWAQIGYRGSVTTVFGTTAALKFRGNLYGKLRLIHPLSLQLDAMFARSINDSHLDNFTPSDLGLCKINGPIEMYDMSAIGGRSMLKLSAILYLDLYTHHLFAIKPFIGVESGSLWDSGVESIKLPEELLEKRKWNKNTCDIAQDKFKLTTVISAGLNIKYGPIALSVKFNNKISDESALSLVKPIDFSVGLAL